MTQGIFITGTQTNVGKTFIASRIVKEEKDKGYKVAYYKPVASGACYCAHALDSDDAKFVRTYANLGKNEWQVSFLYEQPYAPHLAAKHSTHPVDINRIQQDIAMLAQAHDIVVVEGIGGIVCPLRDEDKQIMLSDIITLLNYPILIVTPSGLGSINSSVLTAFYAKQMQIQVLGFIMNEFDETNPLHQDNKKMINKLSGYPVLGHIIKNGSKIIKTDITYDYFNRKGK